jgi:hypothetical protein
MPISNRFKFGESFVPLRDVLNTKHNVVKSVSDLPYCESFPPSTPVSSVNEFDDMMCLIIL